jgi:valyl-tRNA synthetase
MLRLPLTGREIPIVTDSWVSREFGTGAVKVTPAHDPNDFALGQRQGLPSISVMDETAHMNAAAGAYAGLDRYKARQQVLADLEAQAAAGGVRDHVNSIGKCDRCKTWSSLCFRRNGLSDSAAGRPAIAAVEQGFIRFTPEQYAKTYFEWMRNIHDWCISRQLWWGHRIPAWHCAACGKITVARTTPEVCAHCGSAASSRRRMFWTPGSPPDCCPAPPGLAGAPAGSRRLLSHPACWSPASTSCSSGSRA